uniref:O-methyltransferase n=1 Tax=Citrus reticulata TaxID=85571 RepID=A0A5K7Y7W3_CITRE|nr:O-methyltransferase [Citrus reticulata]
MDMNHMINAESSSSSSELLKAQAQVWNCAFSYINSMALKCAVELGIPDVIHKHGQPMTLSLIASTLDIQKNKAHCIQRLMRILVHSGFFAQKNKIDKDESEVYYSLTPASRLLLKDEPLRAAPFMFLITHPIITTPFNFLSSWFKNDDPSTPTVFESTHGKDIWGCLAQEAKFKNVFYDAMMTDSQFISSVLIKDCKEVFKGLKCLVDLGGGTGTMAKAIAEAFPEMKCIVFDLPHVVDNNLQQQQGTNKNLEFLGGDMFEAIPPADAVLLKWVLHNWGDKENVKILKKCKEAIDGSKDKGGKVIVIDMVIEDQSIDKDSTKTQLCSDMLMMSLFSVAKERSIKEWKKLFLEAGFSHYNVNSTLGLRSLIELYP